MSILDIKARFSQRVLDAEKDSKDVLQRNGSCGIAVNAPPTDVQEVDVGILKYVSDLPGFHAVIKQRYSDFNVHEIDVEDKVVILNSFDVPDEDCSKPDDNFSLLSDGELLTLEKLVNDDETVTSLSIDVTELSKDDRRSIHRFIKGKYGSKVVSGTKEEGSVKSIIVTRPSKKEREPYPPHLSKYVHFILCKQNIDTSEAMHILGSKLRVRPRNFTFSGSKDKRGNTSQWVCVRQVLASRLSSLNSCLRKLKIGNFVYKEFPLRLGALNGNLFEIALRDISAPDDVIEDALTKLRERGFINYFGLQRFGKCAVSPTHEIGRQIIKEAYANAVELILKPRGSMDQPDMKQAREIWTRTRDPGQALSALRSKNRTIEGKLLIALKKNGPTAFVNALDCLPRHVRLLYIHAYQSLVWNKIASRRIAKYGLLPIEGDLVYADPNSETAVVPNDDDDPDDAEDETERIVEKKVAEVKILTNEDLSSNNIYDIVLPIAGTDTVYPKNEIADWYKEILAEDGLTIDSFGSRARQYSLQGSYRKFLQRPKNLTWKVVRYSNPDDDLLLSDVDILEGKTAPYNEEGDLKALVVKFQLTSSSYATMALREILRSDTSASNQSQLHNATKRSAESIQNGESKKRKTDDSLLEQKTVDCPV